MITVVIPTYNGARYLNDSLNSVIVQSYKDWECHVIDNDSTDNTKEIVEGFVKSDPRIRYHYYDKLVPIWDNFNRAFTLPLGSYLKFLAVDDYLAVNYLEESIRVFEQDHDISIISVKGRAVTDEKELLGEFENNYFNLQVIPVTIAQRINFRSMSNELTQHPSFFIIRTDPILKNEVFFRPELNKMGWALDWEWVLRIFNYANLYLINKELVYIRVNPYQEGSRVHRECLEIKEKYQLLDFIAHHLEDYFHLRKKDVRAARFSLYDRNIRYIYKEIQTRKFDRARKYLVSLPLSGRFFVFTRCLFRIPYFIIRGTMRKLFRIKDK